VDGPRTGRRPRPADGGAWAGNPYSYAGNVPLHALDPLGLRPATDADLDAYAHAHAHQGASAAAGEWWGDNWEYVAAGVVIAADVALMFTGVGGPLGDLAPDPHQGIRDASH